MRFSSALLALCPAMPGLQDQPSVTLETRGLPEEPVLVEVAGGWRERVAPAGWIHRSALFAGDLDRDGTGDLAIASFRATICGNDTEGAVELVSGASGKLLARRHADVWFELADVDATGRLEVWDWVSASYWLRLREGPEDRERWARPLQSGVSVPARFVGDVDGDGLAEVAFCEPEAGLPSSHETFALTTLLSGGDGRELWSHLDPRTWKFGQDLAPAGDVDGDGRPDVAVLAEAELASASNASLTVLSGADGTVLEERPLDALDERTVLRRIHAAGDLDGDGRLDFVVEGKRGGGPVSPVVVSGRTLEPIDVAGGSLAFWAAGGDLDGDGDDDLVVGRMAGDRILAVYSGGRLEELRRYSPEQMDWSRVGTRAAVGRLREDGPWQVLVTTDGASWMDGREARALLIPGR